MLELGNTQTDCGLQIDAPAAVPVARGRGLQHAQRRVRPRQAASRQGQRPPAVSANVDHRDDQTASDSLARPSVSERRADTSHPAVPSAAVAVSSSTSAQTAAGAPGLQGDQGNPAAAALHTTTATVNEPGASNAEAGNEPGASTAARALPAGRHHSCLQLPSVLVTDPATLCNLVQMPAMLPDSQIDYVDAVMQHLQRSSLLLRAPQTLLQG